MRLAFTLMLLLGLTCVALAGNPLPYTTPDPNAKTGHIRLAPTNKYTWWKYCAYWPGKEVHTSWFDHGVGSAALYEFLYFNRNMSPTKASIYVLVAGALWEVKDGLVPYELWGKLGGEGVSYQDFIRDASGVAVARVFNKLTNKHNNHFTLRFEKNGVRIVGQF